MPGGGGLKSWFVVRTGGGVRKLERLLMIMLVNSEFSLFPLLSCGKDELTRLTDPVMVIYIRQHPPSDLSN